MTTIEEVRTWADELCETATQEGRAGKPMLANRIASNAALKFYYDNVHGLHSIPADAFPYFKQAEWGEITRLYEAYQQDQKIAESVDRVGALEAKLDKLAELVAQLVEAKEPPAAVVTEEAAPAKAKKADKKPAKAEAVVEGEAEAVEEAAETPDPEPEADTPEADAESEE